MSIQSCNSITSNFLSITVDSLWPISITGCWGPNIALLNYPLLPACLVRLFDAIAHILQPPACWDWHSYKIDINFDLIASRLFIMIFNQRVFKQGSVRDYQGSDHHHGKYLTPGSYSTQHSSCLNLWDCLLHSAKGSLSCWTATTHTGASEHCSAQMCVSFSSTC